MSSRFPRPSRQAYRAARWLVLGVLLLSTAGCTRAFYRRRADKDAYGLVGCAATDPRWALPNYSIEPNPASRFFDPDNPDHPPIPPDDPTSHQLMHCPDCKRGACCWHHNGDTPGVDNPAWKRCLPYGDDCVVPIDRQTALRLALVNSREYQFAAEALYLSALDVSFQRFRFQTQFFGQNSTFYTQAGPLHPGGPTRELRVDDSLQANKLLASGGELVVGLANSLVWEFAGPNTFNTNTLLNFSLVQPLLRGGGRAVVLENLTQAERDLLANVRQMEYFRDGFYVQIVAGRTAIPGPIRTGINLGNIGPTTQGTTGGFLALLSDQVRIRNQRANVSGLRDSLDQIESYYDAGRIDRLQVDQARQALFSAQRGLLSLETGYEDRLDAYKLTLGLPPDLKVRVADPLLDPLLLIDPRLNAASDATSDLLERLRAAPAERSDAQWLDAAAAIQRQSSESLEFIRHDLQTLREVLPTRREEMRQLATREEVHNGDVDPRAVDVQLLDQRVATFNADFAQWEQALKEVLGKLAALHRAEVMAPPPIQAFPPTTAGDSAGQPGAAVQPLAYLPATPPQRPEQRGMILRGSVSAIANEAPQREPFREQLRSVLQELSDVLLALSLVQARVRLETIRLVPVDLDPAEAFQTARECRLDWMNVRAALVDQWRQIRVVANALRSDLNVIVNGEINTIHNNPANFASSTGQVRLGLQFDPPLTRLVERNAYRETLINYQRARRAYSFFEDRVNQDLRSILRSIRQTQLDFELRRVGVHVAISQVDITRERLRAPPKPGDTGTTFGATTARDLTQAYSGLLTAQNDLLAGWVDYEVDRLNLDLSLGTMQLDRQGAWIDPGPIKGSQAAAKPEEVPAPDSQPTTPPGG